jgi:hypothetical protein
MRRHSRRLAMPLVLACAALSGGCDTLGNGRALAASPQALGDVAVVGRSTREDVLRNLGEANIYRFANGAESWTYRETHGLPRFVQYVPVLSAANLLVPPRVTEVAFLFDARGVLLRIDRRE